MKNDILIFAGIAVLGYFYLKNRSLGNVCTSCRLVNDSKGIGFELIPEGCINSMNIVC